MMFDLGYSDRHSNRIDDKSLHARLGLRQAEGHITLPGSTYVRAGGEGAWG